MPLTLSDLRPEPPRCAEHPTALAVAQLEGVNLCADCYAERSEGGPGETEEKTE